MVEYGCWYMMIRQTMVAVHSLGDYPILGYSYVHCSILPADLQENAIKLNSQQKALQSLLRQIRKEAGLSQQELADLLEKPQSFVSKYESGERRLDILELRQICQHIGISLTAFAEHLDNTLTDNDESKSEVPQSR